MNIYNEEKLIKEIADETLKILREIPKDITRLEIDEVVGGLLDVSREGSTLLSNISLSDIPLSQESSDHPTKCSIVLGIQFYNCYKINNQWKYKRVDICESGSIDSIKFNDAIGTIVPYPKNEEILTEVVKRCYESLTEGELESLLKPVFDKMLEKVDESIFNFTVSLNSHVKDSIGETVTLTDILLDEEGIYNRVLHVFMAEDELDEKQKIDLQEVINRYGVDGTSDRRTILIPKKPDGALVAIIVDSVSN